MESVKRKLAVYQRKTIQLNELEQMLKPYIETYDDFTTAILRFEEEGILEMVKSKGRTTRTPSLQITEDGSEWCGDKAALSRHR